MRSDFLYCINPKPVSVTCCGRAWQLEAHTAAQWLAAIAVDVETLVGVVPGLLADEDVQPMSDFAATTHDIERRWLNAARMAVQRASGRDWWWTVNLISKATAGWTYLNGILQRQGVSASGLPLPDWLDAAFTVLWERGDEQAKLQLELELSAVPKDVRIRRSGREIKASLEAFAAD